VRQPGHAKILELIVYRTKSGQKGQSQDGIEVERPSEVRIGDLGEAWSAGVLRSIDEGRFKMFKDICGKFGFSFSKRPEFFTRPEDPNQYASESLARKLSSQPPNLLFNVQNALPKSRELWTFAIVGIALQLIALVIPAVMTYYWRKPKGKNPVQDYAYPTFLVGTYLLVVSIALCSFTIETATVEQVFAPADDRSVEKVFWLQLQQNMGDQPFKAYILLKHAEDKRIRTSRYWPEDMDGYSPDSRPEYHKPTVIFAVGLCLTGFVCQFVGLRALHWSATVIQLGTTLLMTCIRAWIRRGISNRPISFQLYSDQNFIALSVGDACKGSWPIEGKPWPKAQRHPRFRPCNSPGDIRNTLSANLITIHDPRIVLRRKLQSLSPELDNDLVPLVSSLKRTMEGLCQRLHLSFTRTYIAWEHIVESNGVNDSDPHFARLELRARYGRVEEVVLHALIAMWRYTQSYESTEVCIAKVSSVHDWRTKRRFLEAQIDAEVSCVLYLANGEVEPRLTSPRGVTYVSEGFRCTGLSIENVQACLSSSGAGQGNSIGYLSVSVGKSAAHFAFELLAGFMDAIWQIMNLKYFDEVRIWSIDYVGSESTLKIDEVVKILMETGLVDSEKDAKILVISSLARCTVWKDPTEAVESTSIADQPQDPPEAVESTSMANQLRAPPPSMSSTTRDESSHREQSISSTSGTAQADELSQSDAATPDDSKYLYTSAPNMPISSVSGPTQAGESSKAGTITSEASVHQQILIADTSSLSASKTIQSQDDKGKQAATSLVSEDQ